MVNKIDGFFLLILEYLVCDRASLHSLLLVSKKFYLASTSDTLWDKINTQHFRMVFEGLGCEGSEQNEWITCRHDAGLPLFNVLKLQWLAHNASRLKIYFGTLRRQSVSSWSIFSCLGDSNQQSVFCGEKIVIVGHVPKLFSSDEPSSSSVFLQQLMYIVPSSATRFHRDTTSKCVLSGYALKEFEASPENCRSHHRHGKVDAGIRVEAHSQYPALTCRRVGDDRLSFLQFDYSEGQFVYKREQYRELLRDLFDKCGGTILVLDYDATNPSSMTKEFRSLYSVVTHHLWSQVRGDCTILHELNLEGSSRSIHRSSSTTSPLLILVTVPQLSVMDAAGSSMPSQKMAVDKIVTLMGHTVSEVVNSDRGEGQVKRGAQTGRMWYVQPVNRDSALGDLTQGLFAGVNWLVRAMIKSKQ